jgi:hypothetical protein
MKHPNQALYRALPLHHQFLAATLACLPLLAQAELPECKCTDFDKLQQERDTAQTLRDRHAAKAKDIAAAKAAGQSIQAINQDYADWEKLGTTAHGAAEGVTGATAIEFTPRGKALMENNHITGWTRRVEKNGYSTDVYDAAKAHAIEEDFRKRGQDLCDFADEAKLIEQANKTSACKGISDTVVQHEKRHQATCRKLGFIKFYLRDAEALAQDEVAAYDAQIAALNKLIAKALKGAELEFQDSAKQTYDAAHMATYRYSMGTAAARARIPDNNGMSWTVSLKSKHTLNADEIHIGDMQCTAPPISREVGIEVKASGKSAGVSFKTFGQSTPFGIKCPKGAGSMVSAAPMVGSEQVTMPLKLSSSYTEDVALSKVAAMLAGAGMTVTGSYTAKLNIICPAGK